MKKNVLVFPCGSEIGLEIYRAIEKSTYFNLIGASSVNDHGRFVYQNYIGDVPFITSGNFIQEIKEIIKDNNIDIIYPTMDSVIAKIKRAEKDIGCKVVASPMETTEICLSKRKTYNLLRNSILTPKVYNSSDRVDVFPVFCKPEIGYGARGTRKILDKEELRFFMARHSDYMILEYLPGNEYTVDCFTNRHGQLIYSRPRCRARIMNGISANTYPVEPTDEFIEMAEAIGKHLSMRGAWFFQAKRDSMGRLALLEIASRLGGSSSLFRGCGINFPLLSLFDILGYDVSILENDYDIEMDRALDNIFKIKIKYDRVYLDYDDTLIIDKKFLNADLIKFVIQCKNEGIETILISKHEGDLDKSLERFGIRNLFNDVIHISKTDCKADYIEHIGSIFIDDSFAERLDVSKKIGIPVFSLDMVMCLIK